MKSCGCFCFFLITQIAMTQQSLLFESEIYFEDAAGNRDTIEVAYDTTANSYYNLDLDELDLKNEFNDEFEVRASHSLDWRRNLKECILSKRIVGSCEKIINISDPTRICYAGEGIICFVKARHQPVKISWNPSDFINSGTGCQAASFFTPDFLYHLIDPRIWIKQVEKRFACVDREKEFIVNLDRLYIDSMYSKEFTFYTHRTFTNGLEDTILGVELVFEVSYDLSPCQLNSETEQEKGKSEELKSPKIFPNPCTEYIILNNSQINPTDAVQILDQNGRLLKMVDELDRSAKANEIIIGELEPGIYVLKIMYKDRAVEFRKFVKI